MQTQTTKQTTTSNAPVPAQEAVIAFTKVNLPYGWLGNMSAEPVVHLGKRYRTTEALFQCLRFEGFPAVQEQIRDSASPMSAKMVAKKHRRLIQDTVTFLGAEDVERMRLCLRLKLEQHPELKRMLRATGNARLVENVGKRRRESDLFWGAYWDDATAEWVGRSVLGECWMELRRELPPAPIRAA